MIYFESKLNKTIFFRFFFELFDERLKIGDERRKTSRICQMHVLRNDILLFFQTDLPSSHFLLY